MARLCAKPGMVEAATFAGWFGALVGRQGRTTSAVGRARRTRTGRANTVPQEPRGDTRGPLRAGGVARVRDRPVARGRDTGRPGAMSPPSLSHTLLSQCTPRSALLS
jgi:hypothetical protein